MNKLDAVVAAAIVLFSCSSSQDVVQDGPFQHRKYINKGWFLDVPKRDDPAPAEARREEVPEERPMYEPTADPEVVMEPVLPKEEAPPTEAPAVEATSPQAEAADPGPSASLGGPEQDPALERSSLEETREDALGPELAQDDVGGINIFALLGFIFAFLVPIAGLVLSIIGLNQTTPNGGDGHGLALAGLIISIVVLAIWMGVIVGPE